MKPDRFCNDSLNNQGVSEFPARLLFEDKSTQMSIEIHRQIAHNNNSDQSAFAS
jgi:hypothetical protein